MKERVYEVVHSIPGRARLRINGIRENKPLANGLVRQLKEQQGVQQVRANVVSASLTLSFDESKFDPTSWFDQLQLADVCPEADEASGKEPRNFVLRLLHRASYAFESRVPPRAQFALGALSIIVSMVEAPVVVSGTVLTASLLPILNRALQTLLDERRLGADALDSAAGLVLLIEGNFFPASVMAFLVGLGEVIRDILTMNCQRMIHHQLALSRRSAWLIRGKKRLRVPVEELRAGDRVVVYEGELIPIEGIILDGAGTIVPANPAMDFEPESVSAGDLVRADTILADGKIFVRYDQCILAMPVDPVLEKEKRRWLQRTRLHRQALRTGYRFVWPILCVAGALFVLTRNFHRAIAVISFDFITGVKIAIPTAVLSSMYSAGHRGIVIRNASAFEKLADVDTVIFARSGTLTSLKPTVTDVFVAEGYTFEDVMTLAAAVEQRYNQIGAYVLYRYARLHKIPVPERSSSNVFSGLGVAGHVEGHDVLVGTTALMGLQDIDLTTAVEFLQNCYEKGDCRVCVAIDGKLAGAIAYQDPLREDALDAIHSLREMGIKEIVMITAGSQAAAEVLAKRAGIYKVHSRAQPEDKAEIVKQYKREGRKVAVVGHDLDDALALEQADVAVALSSGAEIAKHRADVVLTSETLSSLVEGVRTAREGMQLARQNLTLVSVPNWFGLGLTTLAQADHLAATLLNNGSVIVGAANGLRPLVVD